MNLHKSKPIGTILIEKGVVQRDCLDEALQEQKQCGSKIGEILLSKGKITHHDVSEAIATQYYLQHINLIKDPGDVSLLVLGDIDFYFRYMLIPWKIKDGITLVVTSDLSSEGYRWAERRYGRIKICIASRKCIEQNLREQFHSIDDGAIQDELFTKYPHYSAKYVIRRKSKLLWLLMVFAFCLISLFHVPDIMLGVILVVVNVYYQIAFLFKASLFFLGTSSDNYSIKTLEISDQSLPVYSILVPLYKEAKVIPQLFHSIAALDYPKTKLDVKIILEDDDDETIKAVELLEKPSYIDVIIVPHSLPKTKPKACNYAVRYIRGDYVTIYDAEDVPEVDQLRKAVHAFEQADEKTVCFQARLNYYNRHVNYLSRFFAIEYSIWFNILLHGLFRFGMPVPLGGTSNHISVRHLKELGYWDPYNVTEDADLGLRIAQEGYKVGLLDSTTWEESPLYVSSWLKQRSRWLKGYLQTYIIHMRSPRDLIKRVGIKGFIGINLFVGAPPLVYLMSPIIWSISILGLLPEVRIVSIPDWIQMLMFTSLTINIVLHIILAQYAITLERWRYMGLAALLFPFYNLLNIFSSYKALWQLFTKPHFWEKTTHGLYLKDQ